MKNDKNAASSDVKRVDYMPVTYQFTVCLGFTGEAQILTLPRLEEINSSVPTFKFIRDRISELWRIDSSQFVCIAEGGESIDDSTTLDIDQLNVCFIILIVYIVLGLYTFCF